MQSKKLIASTLVLTILAVIIIIGYLTMRHNNNSPFIRYASLIPNTYRVGFTNLDQEYDHLPLVVQGAIPSWVSGTLLRNGPAKFYTKSSWVLDWFDGLAMIHAFTINNGLVTYKNKFLHSNDYSHVQKTGKMNYAGFAQDPCGSRFQKIISAFFPTEQPKESLPNANVNITQYTNRFVALTEIPLPIEFDPQTLHTLGAFIYADTLPKKDIHDTAHPHYDPVLKKHYGYYTAFGRTSTLNLYSIADGSTSREIISSIPFEEPSYMHSFSITKQYAIFTALPFVVNPLDLMSGKPFIQNYRWKPELGTRIIIIDRNNGALVQEITAAPFFAFHTVNAYEEDNKIYFDIVTYPDAHGIGQATFDQLLAPNHVPSNGQKQSEEPDADNVESGILTRFVFNLKDGKASQQKLSDAFIELPRINYAYNGIKYTYAYAFAQSTQDERAYVADQLTKINVKTGEQTIWQEPDCYPGEPVFIANPNGKDEDDGIVTSVVLDAKAQTSFLIVLDAKSFTELARARVPHHIPFGIHGQFYTS